MAKRTSIRKQIKNGPIGVTFSGWDKTWQRIRALEKTAPEAVIIGLMALGERIMSDAVKRVPVDTGRLRSSGYVAPPARTGVRNAVEIGFGTDYAIPVHERTELTHTTGEAKFLQNAIIAKSARAVWQVAEFAEKYIEKGGQAKGTKFPQSPRGGDS